MVKHPLSYQKTFKQLATLAKQPFTLEGITYTPPRQLTVSELFFRKYGCYLQCGACCLFFSLDYLPAEKDQFCALYPDLADRFTLHSIDSQPIWQLANAGQTLFERTFCQYLNPENGACSIHQLNPFSCQIELIKFMQVQDRGYVFKKGYGRPWMMTNAVTGEKGAVLCDFSDFSIEQFEQNDLPSLHRMLQWARYFEIDTWLPDIIRDVQYCVQSQTMKKLIYHV